MRSAVALAATASWRGRYVVFLERQAHETLAQVTAVIDGRVHDMKDCRAGIMEGYATALV